MRGYDDLEGDQRHSIRRFTTLEGWRDVRLGLQLAAGSTLSTIIANPAYDQEWHLSDDRRAQVYPPRSLPIGAFQDSSDLGHLGCGHNRQLPPEKVLSKNADDRAVWSKSHTSFSLELKGCEIAEANKSKGCENSERPLPQTPFHSFTRKEKWLVVITIGVAGLFSNLSSYIYYLALDDIAEGLKISIEDVSLTITSYLVVQGIAPLIWGPLSEAIGRRPIYISSLSIFVMATIVLTFSPNFVMLLVFRAIQSAGSASTISIGNGVIQDIATPMERGGFIGFYQAIRDFSIAVGPIIGGALAEGLGFRSIFIFLITTSSIVLAVIVVFLPETLRCIARDGSWSLRGIYRPISKRWTKRPGRSGVPPPTDPRPEITAMSFLRPLKLLAEKDISVSLVFGGTVYTIWGMVVDSTTPIFKRRFRLDDLDLGLIMLPNGFGTILGPVLAGKVMTHDFQTFEKAYLPENPSAAPPSESKACLPLDFPIEHARLRHVPCVLAVFALATGAYGFTVLPAEHLPLVLKPGWIAVPLILQFIIATTSSAIFAMIATLVTDLCPGQGASSTAVNNLVRCSMGALGSATVDLMIEALGTSMTFLVLALGSTISGALLAAEWIYGMRWRADRARTPCRDNKARQSDRSSS